MDVIAEVFGKRGKRHQVMLYIPSTVDIDTPLDVETAEWFKHEAVNFMTRTFGGATALSGVGGSMVQDTVVMEPVTIVYSYTDTLTTCDLQAVLEFALQLKEELRQFSVSVEVDGELLFI